MGLRSAFAAVAALLACAAPAAAVETGVNETLGQTVPTAQKAERLGADWVRLWASWEALQPARGAYDQNWLNALNGSVAALKARGVKVLVVVHRAPAWASGVQGGIAPPRDPASFGAFMGGLAQRVPGADAWELWNEPDGSEFWLDGPDPARYAAMVRAAYPAIKAVQPGDVVVTGGTAGNDMDFLQSLYDHGAGGHFDAVGVHTDTACLTNGPDAYYRDERGRVGRYTFTGYREVHAVMSAHGDGAKPIWMTELGGYGLFRASGRAKPSARAFKRLRRGIRPRPRCGGHVDRTPPTLRVEAPADGRRFADKITVRVRAYDNRGGSGIGRIFLSHNGRHVRSWGGSGGSIAPWWESEDWRPGGHTLTFSVRDHAHNETTVSVTVVKVRRASKG
jgi:hypothetical protein